VQPPPRLPIKHAKKRWGNESKEGRKNRGGVGGGGGGKILGRNKSGPIPLVIL